MKNVFRKIGKNVIAVALMLTVLAAIAVPALAAGTDVYADRGLNIRSGPGTNYAIVGGLEKGDAVKVISVDGKWAKIEYKNQTAYVYNAYLKGDKPAKLEKRYATAGVNVRAGAGTKYKIVGALEKGMLFETTGVKKGSWTQGLYQGKIAYVYTKYLSATAPIPVKPAKKSETSPVYAYTKNITKMYDKASTSGTLLLTIPANARLLLVAGTGNSKATWVQAQFGPVIGYVERANLLPTEEEPEEKDIRPLSMYLYAAADTRLYEKTDTASATTGLVKKDERVYCRGSINGWYLVTTDKGVSGYALISSFVTTKPVPPAADIVPGIIYKTVSKRTNSSFVPILSTPKNDLTFMIGKIPAYATTVTELGTINEFSYIRVKLNGVQTTGYVLSSYLSEPEPN